MYYYNVFFCSCLSLNHLETYLSELFSKEMDRSWVQSKVVNMSGNSKNSQQIPVFFESYPRYRKKKTAFSPVIFGLNLSSLKKGKLSKRFVTWIFFQIRPWIVATNFPASKGSLYAWQRMGSNHHAEHMTVTCDYKFIVEVFHGILQSYIKLLDFISSFFSFVRLLTWNWIDFWSFM